MVATIITDSWVKIRDPQFDTIFYANPATGECLLEKPRNVTLHPVLGEEWWELWDDNHKLPYYYNTTNGQTGWDVPSSGTIIPLKKIQNSSIGKRLSVVFTQDDFDINASGTGIGNDSKQTRTSTSLLSPNGNQQQISVVKSYRNQQEEFDKYNNNNIINTIITTTPASPTKYSSYDVDSNSVKSGKSKNSKPKNQTINESENVSQKISNTSIQSNNDKPIQGLPKRNNSTISSQIKTSQLQTTSSTSIPSTSTSRPIIPSDLNAKNNNGAESYVNMQQQSYKMIPPNKTSAIADKARKTGISDPVVNFVL